MRRTGLVVVAGLLCQIAAQSDCAALFSSVVKAHDFENSVPEHLLRSDEATFNLTRSRVAHLSSAFRDHAERAYTASRRSANATATAAERALGIAALHDVYSLAGRFKPFTFLVGFGRSGTTLFRGMLSAHPSVYILDEVKLFHWMTGADFPAFARAGCASEVDGALETGLAAAMSSLLEEVVRLNTNAASLPQLIGIKLPHREDGTSFIGSVHDLFPNARFIHIVRDGRAVALSSLEWLEREDTMVSVLDTETMTPPSQDITKATTTWAAHERSTLAERSSRNDLAYFRLHFEELVNEPEGTLRRALEFLGLPWDGSVLEHYREPDGRSRRLGLHTKENGAVDATRARHWQASWDKAKDGYVSDDAAAILRTYGYLGSD